MEAFVDGGIVERLGGEALRQVLASLWPEDCQTCGQPLAGSTPVLAVEDAQVYVAAALHHPRCRKSEWNDGAPVAYGASTWKGLAFVLRGISGGDGVPDRLPVFLLNPGLECVLLRRGAGDRWSVLVEAGFDALPVRRPLEIGPPVTGADAVLLDDEVAVRVGPPLQETYTAGADPELRAEIGRWGGLQLLITHAVNPAEVHSLRQLLEPLAGDRTHGAWVALRTA